MAVLAALEKKADIVLNYYDACFNVWFDQHFLTFCSRRNYAPFFKVVDKCTKYTFSVIEVYRDME